MVFKGGSVGGRHVVKPECVFQRRVSLELCLYMRLGKLAVICETRKHK